MVEKYLNESEIKPRIKAKIKKMIRYYNYFCKILLNKNDIIVPKENHDNKIDKILLIFFISFCKTISIFFQKYKKDKNERDHKKIIRLNCVLQNLSKIIAFSFLSGNINDNSFELIIKILLDLSLEKVPESKNKKIEELKHMIFFKESIKLIKMIFNHFPEYTQKKKDLMNNIIIHISNNLLGTLKNNNINYSNKHFLSQNDYKTSLLIELSYIITKMKSPDITNNFIELLTNIYAFQFKYVNCMKPTLKLLEPLLLNINNKKLHELKEGLDITDFTLNFINSLNSKEKEILEKNPYLMKQGFYFGNQISCIYGDINNLENDFLILFSVRLESDELSDVSFFEITHEGRTQIKVYLEKTINDKYELQIELETGIFSANFFVSIKKTYIFIFHFMVKKFLKIIYIKDSDDNKKDLNCKINCGSQIKFKNIRQSNLKIWIGCKRERHSFKNNFIGLIGDFIIFNTKHIKENKFNEIYEEILNLKSGYSKILEILSNNNKNITLQKDTYYILEDNKTFNEINGNLNQLTNKAELKSNFTINTFISSKYFNLVEYKDDIDYLDSNNNPQLLEKPLSLKYKYINYFKSDSYKKNININSSLFNRYFHILERRFSLLEFVKYEGINYLSFIFEFYYQIICHLIEIEEKEDKNNLNYVFEELNEKIITVLNFINKNIIKTNVYEKYIKETKQLFYQMISLIFKLVEIRDLNLIVFKSICEILNTFNIDLE